MADRPADKSQPFPLPPELLVKVLNEIDSWEDIKALLLVYRGFYEAMMTLLSEWVTVSNYEESLNQLEKISDFPRVALNVGILQCAMIALDTACVKDPVRWEMWWSNMSEVGLAPEKLADVDFKEQTFWKYQELCCNNVLNSPRYLRRFIEVMRQMPNIKALLYATEHFSSDRHTPQFHHGMLDLEDFVNLWQDGSSPWRLMVLTIRAASSAHLKIEQFDIQQTFKSTFGDLLGDMGATTGIPYRLLTDASEQDFEHMRNVFRGLKNLTLRISVHTEEQIDELLEDSRVCLAQGPAKLAELLCCIESLEKIYLRANNEDSFKPPLLDLGTILPPLNHRGWPLQRFYLCGMAVSAPGAIVDSLRAAQLV